MFPWWEMAGGAANMFFGSEPEYQMTPAEAWRLKIARMMYREAKGRVPGAAPDERSAMAEANALISQQGAQMAEGLFAESGGGSGDTSGSSGDLLTRMNQMLLSNKAAVTASMMASFVRNKRSDMQNAVGMAGGGGGQWQGGEDFSGLFAQIAQGQAYDRATRQPTQQAPVDDKKVAEASREFMQPLPAREDAGMADDAMGRMAGGTGAPSTYGAAYGAGNPSYRWWQKGGVPQGGGRMV